MYYKRVLSSEEALYVSRAQQKIAELSAVLAEEILRNDVTFENTQLIVELQYSIQVLTSSFLDWSKDDIQMMMDYYSLNGDLYSFVFKSLDLSSWGTITTGNWATVEQLLAVAKAADQADKDIIAYFKSEVIRLEGLIAAAGGGSSSAVLTEAVTVYINIGGIKTPKTYAIGTLIDDILQDLFSIPAKVSALTFAGYQAIIEVGAPITVSQFTWGVEGTPTNLKLSDNKGVLTNQPVTGGSYTPGTPIVYNTTTNGPVIWTLTGDNIDPITLTSNAYFKSYFGKQTAANDTPLPVTEAMILASTVFGVFDTTTLATLVATTSNTEQGWFAVHKAQTAAPYTKWTVDSCNSSDITIGEFVILPVDVLVNGATYSVYRWGYRSPINKALTLHR